MDIRLATRADVPQLRALFNAQYARQKGEDYFHWQYFDSAWPTVVACAVDDGQVVGMFGLQCRQLTDGTQIGQAIDLLLAPHTRGSGLFAQLGAHALAQMPALQAVCVLPNANGCRAVVKALRWTQLAQVPALEWTAGQPLGQLPPGALDIGPLHQFGWSISMANWRFSQHPQFHYERYGQAVTKVFTDPATGHRLGDLVDAGFSGDDLLAAIHGLVGQGVERVTTWALPHEPSFAALCRIGFVPVVQERYFCVRVLDPHSGHLGLASAWSLRPADAEFY